MADALPTETVRGGAVFDAAREAAEGWTPVLLDDMAAQLAVDGTVRGEGSGRDLIEGPFGALCEHLERTHARAVPQAAGRLVSIASLAGFYRVEPGDLAPHVVSC